jgi:transposase
MPKVLSATKLQSVLSKLDAGLSHSDIHDKTGVSMGYISKLRRIHRPNLPLNPGGRPSKISPTAARHAVRLATNSHSATAVQVAADLQNITGESICAQTVRNTLKQEGLRAVKKSKKPLMPPRIKSLRLAFARAHLDWTLEDWKRVIWSDETKVNRLGSDGKQWAWKQPGEGLSDRLIQPTAHSGGGSVTIWGCMLWDGPGYMTKLERTMTKEVYLEVLGDELMQTMEYYGKEVGEVVFQQDNAPSHKAHVCTAWFEEHGFEVLDWPPNSPDLNPIENLWSQLKMALGKHENPPGGIVELWQRIEQEWEEITPKQCQDLIESMPRRMSAVIAAKGGPTKY